MAEGWIQLHRRMVENPLWGEKPFSRGQAWIDLLLMANWKDDKMVIGNAMIECKRGQSIRSLDSWAKRWGWSKSAVRRFLDLLKVEEMIDTENVKKTTRLTICNYESYQERRNDTETIVKRLRNDDETILAPREQGNKVTTEQEQEGVRPPLPTKAKPKDLAEVAEYFSTLEVGRPEAENFFDYYSANGWKQGGGKPIKDWQAAARNWIRRIDEYGSKKQNGRTKQNGNSRTYTPDPKQYEQLATKWGITGSDAGTGAVRPATDGAI